MNPATVVLIGQAFLVGLALGLWLGERGRNRDVRELARLQLERERPETGVFRRTATGEMVPVTPEEAEDPLLLDSELERMAKDIAAEAGVSIAEAREEAQRLVGEAATLGGPGR